MKNVFFVTNIIRY